MKLIKAYYTIAYEIPGIVFEFQNAIPIVFNAYCKRTTLKYGVAVCLPLNPDDEIEGFESVTVKIKSFDFTFETKGTAPICNSLAIKLIKEFIQVNDKSEEFETGKQVYPID